MILSVTRIRRSTGSCGGVTSAIRRIGWPAACRICSPSALNDDSTRSPVFALVRIPGHEYFCVRKYRYSSAQTRSGTRSDLFPAKTVGIRPASRSEEHTSELQSRPHLVCRLLLEKKKKTARDPLSLVRAVLYYVSNS